MFVSPAPDTASILHADLDSFYASVEQRDDPSLRGKPIAVGASPTGGVVLAASYEAKAFGVSTPMGGVEAWRLCPDLISVPPRFSAYSDASDAVFDIFRDTTPLVEGISIDEAFLDVGGLLRLSGTPTEIATHLRARVRAEVGLPITVGVARTKFLAKVASGVGKPDGLLVVEPHGELDFLHPLPVQRLWGVGAVTAQRLNERGVYSVGDVAALSESAVVALTGKAVGRHLYALAHNLDPRPVETGRRRRSVGAQHALGRRDRTRPDCDAVLAGLVDRVTGRLRGAGRAGRTVTIRVRFHDFTCITRSHTLPEATASSAAVRRIAGALLDRVWLDIEDRGISLLGVAVSQLVDDHAIQMALPFEADVSPALDAALDAVHDRFGGSSLRRGSSVGRTMVSMPLLPD
ncbi:MAG: DNA polymerase IV [Actinomycetota bacterium]